MAIAVALWSMAVSPGEPAVIAPPADLRITNVALGEEVADESGRTTVKLIYRTPGANSDDEEEEEEDEENEDEEKEDKPEQLSTAILCSLTCGKIEQATVDVVLTEEDEYLIEVVGKNTVYLTGNYIDQRSPDEDPYDDDESEEDFDLRDVSSDVEIDPAELDVPSDDEGRFEEVEDEKPESKKRPRESDAMEVDGGKLSKAQKKKKQKGEDGKAVEVTTEKPAGKEKKEKGKDKAKQDTKSEQKAETKTIQGGVQVLDHKVGAGPKAKAGDTVSMRYIGKLQNGKIFDKNIKGKPFVFHLGKGEVIKGWDVGIVGMQVGSERLLTIPAPMAYGKKKQEGIPANSTLIFEVKLLEIK